MQTPAFIPNAQTIALRAKSEVGSQEAPVDLSMLRIPFDPASPTPTRSTANCYVVTGPGWYQFPIVYGNAIKDGIANESAYSPSATGSSVLQNFIRHDKSPITAPYLKDNGLVVASASAVWQDWKEKAIDKLLVEEVALNGDFIRFHIAQESIHEGNAVIAAKDASGTVLWSWHIWVTSQTLTAIPVRNNWVKAGSPEGGFDRFDFLSDNLGAVLASEDISYEERHLYIRFTNAGDSAVAHLLQHAGFIPVSEYSCPYYQWGRKDPMQPGYAKNGNSCNKIWFDASGAQQTGPFPWADWHGSSYNQERAKAEIASTIENPGTFNYGECMDCCYSNLWNGPKADFAPHHSLSTADFSKTVKTVYDPSPSGFVLPPTGAFTGFTTTGENSHDPSEFNVSGAFDKGWSFHTGLDHSGETIFIPACGLRIGPANENHLRDVGKSCSYWTNSPGTSNTNASFVHARESEFMQINTLRDRAYPLRVVAE